MTSDQKPYNDELYYMQAWAEQNAGRIRTLAEATGELQTALMMIRTANEHTVSRRFERLCGSVRRVQRILAQIEPQTWKGESVDHAA